MTRKPTTTYVTASPQTWELIRAAYLSGLSAPTVAARFGVSVTALRKRAAREGWTKQAFARAQAPAGPHAYTHAGAPPPTPARDPLDTAIDEVVERHMLPEYLEPEQVARRALGLSARALAGGRAQEAERLARAARAIAGLCEVVPAYRYSDWEEDEGADPDGRRAHLRAMAVTIAMTLAERIAAGLPLPAEFEAVRQERLREGRPL